MQPKHILIAFCVTLTVSSFAQFKKGDKMIGSSIAGSTISSGKTLYSYPNGTQGYTSNQNNFTINLNPSYGWFIQNNIVVGVQPVLVYSRQKTWLESENGNTYKKDNYSNLDFGAGAFLRYFFSSGGKLYPFATAYVNAGSGSTNTDGFYYLTNYSQTYTGSSSARFFYNAGITAGITKLISTSAGLEAFIGYVHSSSKFTTTTTAHTNDNGNISITEYKPTQEFSGNGVNIGIGLQIFLR